MRSTEDVPDDSFDQAAWRFLIIVSVIRTRPKLKPNVRLIGLRLYCLTAVGRCYDNFDRGRISFWSDMLRQELGLNV